MLAGADGVAVDTVACLIVGIDPQVAAYQNRGPDGLGCGILPQIDLSGPPIEALRTTNFRSARRAPVHAAKGSCRPDR